MCINCLTAALCSYAIILVKKLKVGTDYGIRL